MRRFIKSLATMGLFGSIGWAGLMYQGFASDTANGEEFNLIKEAEMPEGFPSPTAVGRIEVKQYPAYRRATAAGMGEFWRLFRHIKQNSVSMTAPVEMEYGNARDAAGKRSMSFLYERPDQGSTGRQGSVDVVDVPPATVVSIGCRGPQSASSVEAARQRLLQWLSENDQYVPAGPMRVMGYNSPFVPRDRNFFEVQIPVERASEEASNS
ncbi:MAG: heme-binding protein [Thermoguttaceae bacterium]|nr:heme-binding protein [Thermoguttaceae bacterium]